MKRIAIIRNSYSYDFGGAELFPINLAKTLNKNGYDAFLLSSNVKTISSAQNIGITVKKSPWWSMQNFSGLRLLLLPLYAIWLTYMTAWYIFFIFKNKVDIIHPQSKDDFISATIAGKLLRKKIIWTDHADLRHIYMNYGIWYKNPVGKLVYRLSRAVDAVTLISKSEKRHIESSLGRTLPSNYIVTYLGVPDVFSGNKQKHSGVVFVTTSRLVKDKGIAELIEAFSRVDNSGARLKICGDGPDADYFKLLAKADSRITFMGHVENVHDVLIRADVLIHPTYHEGFGLSLAEAEMCELAIIASNVGSIPEIVEDGVSGITIEPKNVTQLAEAMSKLADDAKLRAKMGKAGRRIYLDKFQFDRIIKEKFLPLYEA